MQNVADAYLETQVLTASPERLHLMVVDAAIRFARQSFVALEEKNIEAAYLALTRSRSCISEILTGIDAKPNPMKNQPGGIITKEMPIHVSNVAIWNPVTRKADRIGFRTLEDGRKVRFYKSNGEVLGA